MTDLTFMYAVFHEGITLYNGDKALDLYSESWEQRRQWEEYFRNICILSNFNDDFDLFEVIHQNKTSTVQKCRKKDSEEYYAVKSISKKTLTQEKLNALINEITCLRSVNDNPNVVSLRYVYESDSQVMLVMELLQGGEIGELKNLKPPQIRKIMKSLLTGLAYIHQSGIMHRDIKPQNIVYRTINPPEPVIVDFGLAVAKENPKNQVWSCGTIGYVAPEVINYSEGKKKYNEKCDVFSLGITFFIMLFGYNPFTASEKKLTIIKNKEAYIEFPNSPVINKQLINLLTQMLHKHPKERISAIEALSHPFFKTKSQDLSDLHMGLSDSQFSQNEPKKKTLKLSTSQARSQSPQFTQSTFKERQRSIVARPKQTLPKSHSSSQWNGFEDEPDTNESTDKQNPRQVRVRKTSFQIFQQQQNY